VAALPIRQKSRILKRWGFLDQEIAAMDPSEQVAEIQQAIKYCIDIGPLPSGPMEDAEPPIILDIDTNQPTTIGELVKRGVGRAIYRVPEASTRPCSYEEALSRFQKDKTLDSADQDHLVRLAADERMIEHWNSIQRYQPLMTWAASPGWLIWHVLVARRAAESCGDYPAKQRHAENAENLAKYLRKKGETDELTCQLLEDLALKLCQPEALEPFTPAPIPISRKGGNVIRGSKPHNSRELKAFMNLMTNHFKAMYGRPLHEVVATLTDSAFPGRETTTDHVRNAVKPPRQKDRSGKP
jgi:hypothetical protein